MIYIYTMQNDNNNLYRTTSVAHIMTKGPMCVTSDTSANDALNLMVSRGFRHLVLIFFFFFTFLSQKLTYMYSRFVTKRAIFLDYSISQNVYTKHSIRWKEHLVRLASYTLH